MLTTTRLRDGVAALSLLAERDVRRLWREVSNAAEAQQALGDLLPGILVVYGEAAAALAADWYDDVRAEAAVAGFFAAEPVELDSLGADALAGFAAKPLYAAEPDWARAKTLVSGGVQSRIANASRATVIESTYRDRAADGWQRVGSGACSFCKLLIARGTVYRSESTADFGAHDHCGCSCVPAWGGLPRPVQPYTPSAKNVTDADRARTREWIASHDL